MDRSRIDAADYVESQYRSTAKLETRMSVWRPGVDGRTPQDVVLGALAEKGPRRVVEVGCGTGVFAARCASELGCDVVAVDSSPAMVEEARARGVAAILGDVRDLPFEDGAFDCAVALWMLHHVDDRDRAIGELARVLRPGGRLVATGNGLGHLAELWELIGFDYSGSPFGLENGARQLGSHFAAVATREVATRAVFGDRAAAAAYLESMERHDLAALLPDAGWPLVAGGGTAVFIADR
jgi:SAM-dependent methyltransferase